MIYKIFLLFLQLPRIIFYFLILSKKIKGFPLLLQPIHSCGHGSITVGKGVRIGYFSASYFSSYSYMEARSKNSKITIGANTWFNNNASIVASEAEISIGNKCFIGINFACSDNDGHSLDPQRRYVVPPSKGVIIGNNVFIGSNVTVLKGVVIGDNSVIGNGSIVTRNVPANVIVAGIPARKIRDI